MNIGIILLSWGIGGSEKRFANLFNYLSTHSSHQYHLVINNYLFEKLNSMGIALKSNNIHVLYSTGWIKWFDRPSPDLKSKLGVRGCGPNFLAHWVFRVARAFILRSAGKSISSYRFDVVHYVFPYFAEFMGRHRARVFSCQDTNLRNTLLKNKFFLDALYNDGFFDIASERIKAVLIAETEVEDNRRLHVGPCSFIDYSITYISTKELTLVFLGRLESLKNPLLFVDIVNKVHQSCPTMRAFMLGDGSLRSDVERRIHYYGLRDVVTVGFHSRAEEILSRAQIFLSLQSQDNYHSQALMEAMACGCAIVASDVGETEKLVSDEIGFRVPLDAQVASEKVIWLLEHPSDAYLMGLHAREKVMREQTIERYSVYLEDIYCDAYWSSR